MAQSDQLLPFDIPLNGRCITAVDPLLIGETDFQSLKNMRPTDQGIKGIAGMSKVNAAATTYTGIRNGFHFKKDQPEENHILVQTNDQTAPATASRLVKSDNTAAIPNQDTFSNFLTLDNNNLMRFSKAPQGSTVGCNGTKNYVWGGNEYRCGYFIVYDPNVLKTKYDYSDIINNTLTDSLNVATMKTIGGGIDANTKVLLHCDNNLTDSSGLGHNFTGTNVTYNSISGNFKFGTHSAGFNGTTSYASIADHADLDMSGGIWTVDVQIKCSEYATANRTIYSQTTNTTNYAWIFVAQDGSVRLRVDAAGSYVVSLDTASGIIKLNQYHHIEVGENGDDYYIFVDGVLQAHTTSASRPANYTQSAIIGMWSDGASPGSYFYGYLDEFRLTNGACRHTAGFSPPISPYSSSSGSYAYVGTTRPIKGAKFYVVTANATAATAGVNYWDGSAWQAVTSLVDGTVSVAGKSLSGTGSITFSDTASVAKVKIYNNSMAYWYQFVFTGVDNTTTVSRVTIDASMQTIKDIWDGIPRSIMSFFTYTSAYNEYSTNVLHEDYDSTDSGTYVNVGGFTSAYYLLAGFAEQTTGISFYIVGDTGNTTASTICTIYYWNGAAWVTVGAIDDNTSEGVKSLNKSGVIMWNPPSLDLEFPTSIKDETPTYYYKITFDKTLSANLLIDYVYGIPAQKTLGNYAFPVFWQDRVWLCDEETGAKNSMKGASYLSDCVFNGTDSPTISFDGDEKIVAAVPLFSRFGGTIYENLVMCKRTETYLVDTTTSTDTSSTTPTTSTNYRVYKVAAKVGCVAPLTMKLCDMGFQLAPGLNRHVAIWQSAGGIVMFDGNSIVPVSDDIQNFFDPTDDDYINTAVIDKFSAFYDDANKEYHWLFATGSSTTLNKEWAYDLKHRKWFEIARGTDKTLQCGWNVQDSLGNGYVYGGLATGYVERLENGTTMDGTAITYSCRLNCRLPAKTAMYRTEIRYLKLTGKVKSTSTQSVAMTHYADGSTTGTAIATIPQTGAGKRIYSVSKSLTLKAVAHSFECSISTTDETIGFEPLLISGLYRVDKEAIA